MRQESSLGIDRYLYSRDRLRDRDFVPAEVHASFA